MKRQKVVEGALFKIPLPNSEFIHSRIVGGDTIVVYDSKTTIDLDIEFILTRKILFRVHMITDIFNVRKSPRWEIIGVYPLEKGLQEPVTFFMQDEFDHAKLRIYHHNGTKTIATFEECQGLERFSIWGPQHVIGRIIDHYSGNTKGAVYRNRLRRLDEQTSVDEIQPTPSSHTFFHSPQNPNQ
jgi:Immunity protein 26